VSKHISRWEDDQICIEAHCQLCVDVSEHISMADRAEYICTVIQLNKTWTGQRKLEHTDHTRRSNYALTATVVAI